MISDHRDRPIDFSCSLRFFTSGQAFDGRDQRGYLLVPGAPAGAESDTVVLRVHGVVQLKDEVLRQSGLLRPAHHSELLVGGDFVKTHTLVYCVYKI